MTGIIRSSIKSRANMPKNHGQITGGMTEFNSVSQNFSTKTYFIISGSKRRRYEVNC